MIKRKRLVEFAEAFDEPAKTVEEYLSGINRTTLRRIATHFLGRQEKQASFYEDMEQIFGPHNADVAEKVFRKLGFIEKSMGGELLGIIHPKTALEFFEYGFQRPDEIETKSNAEIEVDTFKAFLVLNTKYINNQSKAAEEAKAIEGLSELSALSLAATHSDFEIVNFDIASIFLKQLIKSIKLFQFLESDKKYEPLLKGFLDYCDCENWREYMRRLLSFAKFVINANGLGNTQITIPQGEDFEKDSAFFDKLILSEGDALVEHDFLSSRANPMFKESEGIYVFVYPLFVAEMLHKALFFKLMQINNAAKPKLLGKLDWSSIYRDEFSEQFLLNSLLDDIFIKRGIAFSGSKIKAGEYLKKDNDGEPDYYYRNGKRILLFESKDVNIKKEAKAGDNFAGYVAELKKKFYFEEKPDGKVDKKAIIQILRNVKRVWEKALTFDTAYKPSSVIIYPILVVHDRQYNMPGLTELVNIWFQEELQALAIEGFPLENVMPLAIIDADTIIGYHESFVNKSLIFSEALDYYYKAITPRQKKFTASVHAVNSITRTVQSFPMILADYAKDRNVVALPRNLMAQIIPALSPDSSEAIRND
jgi:hypothetical protein